MEQQTQQKNEHSSDIQKTPIPEDWCTLALEDMEEFIESQGIYIRQ